MSKRASKASKRRKGAGRHDDATTKIVRIRDNGDGTKTLGLEWNESYAGFAAKMLGRRKLSATHVAQFFGACLIASRASPSSLLTAKPSDVRAHFAKLTAKAKKPNVTRTKKGRN